MTSSPIPSRWGSARTTVGVPGASPRLLTTSAGAGEVLVMGVGAHRDDGGQSGGQGRLEAVGAVLDHDHVGRVEAHAVEREQVDVGRGLLVRDHVAGEHREAAGELRARRRARAPRAPTARPTWTRRRGPSPRRRPRPRPGRSRGDRAAHRLRRARCTCRSCGGASPRASPAAPRARSAARPRRPARGSAGRPSAPCPRRSARSARSPPRSTAPAGRRPRTWR